MNYTIHINGGRAVAHSRTEAAAIKRARSLAPLPPNGCFAAPGTAGSEVSVRRTHNPDGPVTIYRCQRVACETRRGLSTKVAVLYKEGSHV